MYSIVIPTCNGGERFRLLAQSILCQDILCKNILVIDTSSTDGTAEFARKCGFEVYSIRPSEFNHGYTRQVAVNKVLNSEVIVFFTQDTILASVNSLQNIINCFKDSNIGASYGRQIPHQNSGVLGSHARLFNYPAESSVKSMRDASRLGIKTAFISNSFAAYRRDALLEVGGFPSNVILGEDTYVAAKMLLAGWGIAYCSEAKVYHSHDYSFIQEFERYFDIGVFHAREFWIKGNFGKAEGEGLKFVLSEIKYLMNNGKGYLLPSALFRTCLKYFGYCLGMKEKHIPVFLKKILSMHSQYWDK